MAVKELKPEAVAELKPEKKKRTAEEKEARRELKAAKKQKREAEELLTANDASADKEARKAAKKAKKAKKEAKAKAKADKVADTEQAMAAGAQEPATVKVMLTAGPEADAAERERLRELMRPVEERILKLLDGRPKQPGIVTGTEIGSLYRGTHERELEKDVECISGLRVLSNHTSLRDLLGQRKVFPSVGVRGSEKKGGWLVYRLGDHAVELDKVQRNILELLRLAAHPAEKGVAARHSLDAGTLPDAYGAQFKRRFNFRDFGCKSMRAFIEKCGKLAIRMKKDKVSAVSESSGRRGTLPLDGAVLGNGLCTGHVARALHAENPPPAAS